MKGVIAVALLSIFLASIPSADANSNVLICYYGSWAVYRPRNAGLAIENLPGDLCTHIIYSFIGANPDGTIRVMDPYSDLSENYGKDGFRKFLALKKTYPDVKLLVAMGGYNEGSIKYSQLFSTSSARKTFANNALAFLQQYGFDGLDLDWEYPAQRGGASSDRANFIELIKELKNVFEPYKYLLTAAVGAAENAIIPSYDATNMGKYLDYINIMAYDFHTGWEALTGHNAPTFISAAEENTYQSGFNVEGSIEAWIRHGAPANKLVLGVGFYGHSFTLVSPTQSCRSVRCPVAGPGDGGPYLNEQGFLGYNEICLVENAANTKIYWDNEAQVPYYVNGNQWVSYDNIQSIDIKLQIVEKYSLGGAMIWSIDTDDFRGDCGKGKFPLLNALRDGLKLDSNESDLTLTTLATPSTTEEPDFASDDKDPSPVQSDLTTTESPGEHTTTEEPDFENETKVVCKNEGFIRDPVECNKFYQCYKAGDSYVIGTHRCPKSLVFDTKSNACNYPELVQC